MLSRHYTATFRAEPIHLPILYRWRVVLRRFLDNNVPAAGPHFNWVEREPLYCVSIRYVFARYPADARSIAARGAGNVVGFVSVDRLS